MELGLDLLKECILNETRKHHVPLYRRIQKLEGENKKLRFLIDEILTENKARGRDVKNEKSHNDYLEEMIHEIVDRIGCKLITCDGYPERKVIVAKITN